MNNNSVELRLILDFFFSDFHHEGSDSKTTGFDLVSSKQN